MRRAIVAVSLALVLAFVGSCSPGEGDAMPAPFSLTEEAMGRYCGMNVLEHDGPKGQIILTGALEPIWFSSVRDAIAFTLLPEEPKNIAAIYVSDMSVAPSWARPGADNWIDARKAVYVIGSPRRGAMGASEAIPFSTEEIARRFVADAGGKLVRFSEIPADYILSPSESSATSKPDKTGR